MIAFRPIEDSDLPLLAGWLSLDFVQRWWREPADLDDRPVGMIQRYRLDDHPEWEATLHLTNAAGIDYLLGDPDLAGRSIGSTAIGQFVPGVFEAYPEVDLVVAVPQQANIGSWRALEKAGFSRQWSGVLDSDDPSDDGPAHVYVIRRAR